VLAFTGLTTPVDWAVVELRSAVNNSVVVATTAVLIQRSGNVMMPSGEQTITFGTTPAGNYHVVLRHRNHLGVMTFAPVELGATGTLVDFTQPSTATYGIEAQKSVVGGMALWAADVTGNGQLKYTGTANDRDPILVRIGGTTPTNSVPGYWPEDVTLDGVVKYTGSGNDRDPILQQVGGTTPTTIRNQQLP
jgi:hypothetical protein